VKGLHKYLGKYISEVHKMLKSKIGILLRTSKYRREYIQKELGVSANTLSNWCTGKTYPTIDKAFLLAKLLEVKLDDLYEFEEEKE
jgi:putative transcriptional regulator